MERGLTIKGEGEGSEAAIVEDPVTIVESIEHGSRIGKRELVP